MCVNFPNFLLTLISISTPLSSENILCMLSVLLKLLRLFNGITYGLFWKMSYAYLNRAYSALVEWHVPQISVRFSWFASLCFFVISSCSIHCCKWGIEISDFSCKIFDFHHQFSFFSFAYFRTMLLGAYVFIIVISS